MAYEAQSLHKVGNSPIRVLLIQDDPVLPEVITGMLRAGCDIFPFDVAHVDRLAAAVARLRQGAPDVILLDVELPDSFRLSGVQVLRAEVPDVPLVVLTSPDDASAPMDAVCAGAQDYVVKGQVDGRLLAHVLRSAVERQRLLMQLRMMSLIDDLTGLHNRRGFEIVAVHQLRLAERYEKNLLLLFTDIDGLGRINDHMGYDEGDRALAEAATAFRESFRTCDIVARWGGDEFVVLTSECLPAKAETLVDRLTANLRFRQLAAGLPYDLRVTVGGAVFDPARPRSLCELVCQADEDMRRHQAEELAADCAAASG